MVDEYIVRTAILDPAISVVRAGARLRIETSWLDSWHCFSYGRHYEPDNTHHGLLLVCNDNQLRGSTGFAEHSHQEMEIVTWPIEGELEHRDCAGGGRHILRPGIVQRLSAGRGIRHSEMNPAGWAPTRYIEMWVPPDRPGLDPGVELAEIFHHANNAGEANHNDRLHDTSYRGREVLVHVLHSELRQDINRGCADRRGSS